MRALVLFSAAQGGKHLLHRFMHPTRQHCFVALCDEERGYWVSYDWQMGQVRLTAEAEATFDLASHYRDQGFEVLETTTREAGWQPTFVLNNCVGHVKSVLGMKQGWLLLPWTPHQLYKALTHG